MRLAPLSALALLTVSSAASAATLEVGPGKTYAAPCAAIAAANDGDTITVDAQGTYVGDVCGIAKNGLTLKGVNGRPKIDAGGKIAQSKGIYAVSGNDLTIENLELFGAHSANGCCPSDQNGAAIRAQGTNITVRGSYLHDNDNGFLNGSATDGVGNVTIENCEFAHNGFGDGFSHNVYVNHVAKLVFRFNYSHDVAEGHLLKTRADTSVIAYNRLTGEGGTDSYEVDIPNGGIAYVIGNLIQQPKTTHNPNIIAFAEEGPHGNGTPDHLYVVNNTIVNDLGSGTFVLVDGKVSTPAVVQNNAFVGGGTVCSQASAMLVTNIAGDAKLVDAATFDYHLAAGSPCVNAGTAPGTGDGFDLTPIDEYVHPASSAARGSNGVIDVGAYELGGSGQGGAGGGGTAGAGGSGTAGTGTAGSGTAGSGTAGSGTAGGGTAGSGTAGTGAGGGKAGGAGASGAGVGGATAGGGGAASGGKSGSTGTAGKAGATSAGGKGGAAGNGTTTGGAAGTGANGDAPAAGDSGGCGCRLTPVDGRGWGLLALGLGLIARRRRLSRTKA
jgi:MYXO-CTERM domain-containing protein